MVVIYCVTTAITTVRRQLHIHIGLFKLLVQFNQPLGWLAAILRA